MELKPSLQPDCPQLLSQNISQSRFTQSDHEGVSANPSDPLGSRLSSSNWIDLDTATPPTELSAQSLPAPYPILSIQIDQFLQSEDYSRPEKEQRQTGKITEASSGTIALKGEIKLTPTN